MKLSELIGMEKTEQMARIKNHSSMTLDEVMKNPMELLGKSLVFMGNWGEFDTIGLAVRIFRYDKEEKWNITDMDLTNGCQRECVNYSEVEEVRAKCLFFLEYSISGFVLD